MLTVLMSTVLMSQGIWNVTFTSVRPPLESPWELGPAPAAPAGRLEGQGLAGHRVRAHGRASQRLRMGMVPLW